MNPRVMVYKRDYSRQNITIPALAIDPEALKVTSYSFQAIGGPYRASLQQTGDKYTLMNALNLLRCPVEIYDDIGDRIWWGIIHEVQIKSGSINIGVSLDNMVNRVTLKYSLVTPGTHTQPQDTVTAVAEDAVSEAEYGTKEELYSYHECSTDEANAVRDTVLAQRKYPVPIITQADPKAADGATIYCRGWWETLGWTYYANAKGLYSYTNGGGGKATIGDVIDSSQVCQAFNVEDTWTAYSVKIKAMQEGLPTADLLAAIAISGVGVYYARFTPAPAGNMPTELDWVEAVFDVPVGSPAPVLSHLAPGGNHYLYLLMNLIAAWDPVNFYWCGLDTGYAPPTGFREWDATPPGNWNIRGKDADGHLQFQIVDRIESIQQIDDILAAVKQFHTSVVWDTLTTGVFSCQFRMGDRTALEEVLDLLKAGTTNKRRMLATWTSDMKIHLFEEPTALKYIYHRDGKLTNLANVPVPSYLCPVGQWVRIDEVVDWDVGGFMANPALMFIETAEYNVANDSLALTSRDAPNPLDEFTLKEPSV
jgi:hypothetical protein